MKIKRTIVRYEDMDWNELKKAAQAGELHVNDEITFHLNDGTEITAVCAKLLPSTDADHPAGARFLFKTAVGTHVMNEKPTNKGGYWLSDCRKYLLDDVLPSLPEGLRKILVPRKITETLSYITMTYKDTIWLPSETDIFGRGDDSWQNGAADGPDDEQCPSCMTKAARIILLKGRAAWAWLRSADCNYSNDFLLVATDGTVGDDGASYSGAVSPGFDI